MTANEKLSYRTDEETLKALKVIALQEGRSVNNLIDRCIKEMISKREKEQSA